MGRQVYKVWEPCRLGGDRRRQEVYHTQMAYVPQPDWLGVVDSACTHLQWRRGSPHSGQGKSSNGHWHRECNDEGANEKERSPMIGATTGKTSPQPASARPFPARPMQNLNLASTECTLILTTWT